jgi:hypothetical protein
MTTAIEPTPDQLALAGPGYDKDALAGFLQEIAEEDQALAAGTLEPPAPAAAPEYETLSVEGDEVEAEQGQRPLAGKFKSTEDLEKAYLELQRKLGQPREQPPAEEAKPVSREEAVGFYGETVVAAAEQQGIDLAQWDAAVQRGEDTAPLREKLAGALGLPAALIEKYEAAFRPAEGKEAEPAALSDQDIAAIHAEVGGQEKFRALGQWASANLSAAELADYNAAIDTGNPAAARAAVRWLQGKAAVADKEPALLFASGGTANPALDVFETEDEAMEAKQVLTKGGKQRYLVDEKYRRYIDGKFARSPIFL